MARIRRIDDGTFAVDFLDGERELLRQLLPELRDLILGKDDLARRLFPPAYANDPERNDEYVAMVGDDLLERRLARLDTIESTLEASSLDEDQMNQWLAALNDMRLVLGTRLDIGEEEMDITEDDPDAVAYAVYQYLTELVSLIVDELGNW